jgi:hypothetical protein
MDITRTETIRPAALFLLSSIHNRFAAEPDMYPVASLSVMKYPMFVYDNVLTVGHKSVIWLALQDMQT